jgi:hypothetical protein
VSVGAPVTMNRFEVANLVCLGLLVAGAAGAAVAAVFAGGWVVERVAPGTRLLFWLGAGDPP